MANDQTTDLSVLNEALVLLGEPPLEAWDQGLSPAEAAAVAGTAAATAAALFRPCLDELLGCHPWVFNRGFSVLARVPGPPSPAAGFNSAWQMPPNMLRAVRPYIDGRPVEDWHIGAASLLLDVPPAPAAPVVELEYQVRIGPGGWRPGFRAAAVHELAARMALSITEGADRAKLLAAQAQRLMSQARHANATEHPALRLPTGRLAARMRRP